MVQGIMYVLLLFVAISVDVFATVSDNETRSVLSNEVYKFTSKVTNITDDKGFWDWIYTLLAKPTTTTISPPIIEPEECSSCTCGLTNTQKRIVGGVETKVNQYPWMALLKYKKRFYCGGSIINSRYVLTAAHCVDRFDPSLMSVVLLEHDRNSTIESQVQEYKVEQVIKHSGYSIVNYNNDIALLKLNNIVMFKGLMRPVCLPEKGKTYSGSIGIVTGWGAVHESGPISNTLQEVMVPILSNAECRATNYPSRRITDNMICAGYAGGNKDSCQGDSGGPLHVLNDNIHRIVGVVSWGEGCAKPMYPGVYTRVNRYLTWIKQNTEDASYCCT
ncbi:trypsin-1-like isoform X1 [Vespa velutina]|uniref:trypsin-1-like isoform X1 n=1 Tax=Vespa velutina TaxID=202808 RepID=UPI001FB3EDCF|nr:trypsin-1-like isoform X1 [Vespa velutina]